ncbi:MAG: hypothetical protein RR497_03650, partial [Oscillospiraceae bacterium]
MAIEKMSLINLVGNMQDLEPTINKCLESGYFQPEMSIHSTEPSHGFSTLDEENPYTDILTRTIKIADDLQVKLEYSSFQAEDYDTENMTEVISEMERNIVSLGESKTKIKQSISMHEQAIIQLKH